MVFFYLQVAQLHLPLTRKRSREMRAVLSEVSYVVGSMGAFQAWSNVMGHHDLHGCGVASQLLRGILTTGVWTL